VDVECDFALIFFFFPLLVVVQVVRARYLCISSMKVFIPFDSSRHLVAMKSDSESKIEGKGNIQ
jgi:hypothetical protein